MLATGNSLIEAIRLYVEKGIPETNICCVCMISSPQGIENVFNNFPMVFWQDKIFKGLKTENLSLVYLPNIIAPRQLLDSASVV